MHSVLRHRKSFSFWRRKESHLLVKIFFERERNIKKLGKWYLDHLQKT